MRYLYVRSISERSFTVNTGTYLRHIEPCSARSAGTQCSKQTGMKIKMQNDPNCDKLQVYVDQKLLRGNLIQGIEAGQTICVEVKIPV